MQSICGFNTTLSIGAALTFENKLPGLRHQMAPAQWVVSNAGRGICFNVGASGWGQTFNSINVEPLPDLRTAARGFSGSRKLFLPRSLGSVSS